MAGYRGLYIDYGATEEQNNTIMPRLGVNPSRTELLLELIANELLRLRVQMASDSDPEELTTSLAEKLDKAIIDQRKQLGLPWNPLTP